MQVFDLRPKQLVQSDPSNKRQDNFAINAHVCSSFRSIVSAINETGAIMQRGAKVEEAMYAIQWN
jgi:hypothetical protein